MIKFAISSSASPILPDFTNLYPTSFKENLGFALDGDTCLVEIVGGRGENPQRKVIKILNELTNNSLVLLDELGSGTDPKEGSNLAISIVEYL